MVSKAENQYSFFWVCEQQKRVRGATLSVVFGLLHHVETLRFQSSHWHSGCKCNKIRVERLFYYCFFDGVISEYCGCMDRNLLDLFFPWGLALPELRGKELKYRKNQSNLLVVQMLTVQQSTLIFSSFQHVVEAWKVYRCVGLKNLATEEGTSTLLLFNGLVEVACT